MKNKKNIINNLIKKYKKLIKYYSHTDEKFKTGLRNISFKESIISIKLFDIKLREAIGKTDNIDVSACSHQAILEREFPLHFCRVCNRDLSIVGVGRYNDFLVLRHPRCRKPICLDCAKNNPDEFHIAFKKGLNKLFKEAGE